MKYELNKIYNEDSYIAIKSIPDNSIDCIYTDIPYLYNNGGGGSSELAQRIRVVSDEYLVDIKDGIDFKILDEFVRVMKKINIFIWCSKLQILDIMKFFIDKHNCYFEILTWNKKNPTPATNNTWLPDIEYCLYFKEGGVKLNNGYELKSKWYSSPINKKDKDLFNHPTIKPIELVKRHLLHTTQPNDIVADFFLGSGTTAVACAETGRQYIGFELSKKWYDIAVNRLNKIDANGQISLFLK
jgi:DNA modification methylase